MEKPAREEIIFEAKTPADMAAASRKVIDLGCRIVLLEGDLGAGKTTFVKALCATLGSDDEVTSPTFTLINEYRDGHGSPIYHIDLYRLNSMEEAIDIGIEEYLASGSWCCIEWPELLLPLVTGETAIRVAVSVLSGATRRIRILK